MCHAIVNKRDKIKMTSIILLVMLQWNQRKDPMMKFLCEIQKIKALKLKRNGLNYYKHLLYWNLMTLSTIMEKCPTLNFDVFTKTKI